MPLKTQVSFAVIACAATVVFQPAYASITTQKVDGIPTEFIAQTGETFDRLKRNADAALLPDGFSLQPYAVVPDARHMAVAPDGKTIFVGTTSDRVWVVERDDTAPVVATVRQFAPNQEFVLPNGVCFVSDGGLIVAEQNRVLKFPNVSQTKFEGSPKSEVLIGQGMLIPVAEESYNHSARVCDEGPDGRIYISLGQPYNVPPKSKVKLYEGLGVGGIISVDGLGMDRQVFATGIRNSVGIEFNPASGHLWFTDNQVDGMGDDIPPEELNKATEAGKNYGFPWYSGGTVRTAEYANEPIPSGVVDPEVELDAHAASLGMMFYTGEMLPEDYKGGVFIAQHGSWNRTEPIGARLIFVPINDKEQASAPSIIMSGWIMSDGGYMGRPVDVVQLADGSLLISDDQTGGIYRLTYNNK